MQNIPRCVFLLAAFLSLVATGCPAGRAKTTLEGHAGRVTIVAIAPNGKIAATAGEDGVVKIWDVRSGKEKQSIQATASDIAISPDGKVLAIGGYESVQLWDIEEERQTATLLLKSETKKESDGDNAQNEPPASNPQPKPNIRWKIHCIAFSPDGKLLAAGSGPTIAMQQASNRGVAIWKVITSGEAVARQILPESATCLAFSPDSKLLAIGTGGMHNREGGTTGYLVTYDVASGKERHNFIAKESNQAADKQGMTVSVAFSPNGKLIASGGSDTEALVAGVRGLNKARAYVTLWDAATGESVSVYKSGLKQNLALAFQDDRTLLVAGGNPFPTMKTGAVKIYDVAAKKEKGLLRERP